MLKKLRRRFVLINMAIVTGMLLVIFGLVIHFTNLDLDAQSDSMLQKIAQNALDPVGREPNTQLPYFTLRFSASGQVVASGKTHYDITDREFLDELIATIYDINKTTGYLEDYHLKYTVVTSPIVQVIAFVDVSSQQSAMLSLLQVSILTAVAALAAFTFISILLARWAVNPVDKAWQQQKQFISDASHELKTPLTVIMSNAELLQDDGCDRGVCADNILASSQQMRHLVEGMLELARADNGQIQTHFENMDLSKTVSDSILPFEPMFFESGLRLESVIEPGILVHGSQQHLHQLTDILLDNAQKYSTPGIVDVKLSRQGKNQCLLTVSNPGTPIPQGELESIFQRFYRSDTARTSSGSFGLGLSIAQRIVQEHGGNIWAESNPSGNRFSVLLPCYPQ
ncbi:MAG: HAMP domain-containing histidine kinase [Oscillospiraceae bacterium]|nr:HAMP domain-containing histidine kinase [Oscillospiraceae bacterium]